MTVLDRQVSASADDGSWSEGTSSFGLLGSNSYWGGNFDSTNGSLNAFVRFTGVIVANGLTIDVAYVQTRSNASSSTTTVNAIWSAIDADNAAAPTTYAGAEGATRTTATVAHNNIPSTTVNVDYQSPSLVTIIQEIVNRVGWASGNALVIYAEDNGSSVGAYRSFYSYNASTTYAPKLHIEYTPSNTAPTVSVAPTVSYGSLTRLGPNNTPAVVSFTATDPEETGANALSYTIRTAAAGAGTLVGSGTCTSGTGKTHNITNADTGLVDGSQTLYLRISDGTLFSADSSFTLLRDTGNPTVSAVTHTPDPVVGP